MKRWIGFLLPLCLLLAGCTGQQTTASPEELPPAAAPGPVPAGELRLLFDSEPDTLDYLASDDGHLLRLAANTVDTLVEYDAFGLLRPGLAEKWSYDPAERTWTITLREDAVWVDGEGREAAPVTAEDFVASARHILTPETDSPAAAELVALLANAEAYYNGLDPEKEDEPIDFSEVGVSARDERTLCYTLREAAPEFPGRLAGRAFLPASALQLAKGDFGGADNRPWSCGAYYLAGYEPQAETLLRKNPRYRLAQDVSIAAVRFVFDPDAAVSAPELAAEGKIGYAPLNDETAAEWLADAARSRLVSRAPTAPERSYFFCFNFNVRKLNADFDRQDAEGWSLDERYEPENWERAVNCEAFRQSLRCAVDRSALYDDAVTENTITPARFAVNPATGTDYTRLTAFSGLGDPHDPDRAREYRDAAVSELTSQGASFPVKVLIRCPDDDRKALARAETAARQLEATLGTDYIRMIVETVPADNYWTLVRRSGSYRLLECFWDADSPDVGTWMKPFYQRREPEGSYGRGYRYAYLACAVTDGTPSGETVRAFFAQVEAARAEERESKRLAAFAAAEAQLIGHALSIPLGTGEVHYAVSRVDRSGCPVRGLARESFRDARLLDRPLTMEESIAAPPEPTAELLPEPARERPPASIKNDCIN